VRRQRVARQATPHAIGEVGTEKRSIGEIGRVAAVDVAVDPLLKPLPGDRDLFAMRLLD
jgi:hypothetical protein